MTMQIRLVFLVACSTIFFGAQHAQAQELLRSDRFGKVYLYSPTQPRPEPQFVIFFPTGATSAKPPAAVTALTEDGAYVALMDTTDFETTLQDNGGSCLPLWEFARFTQVLEGKAHLKKFVDPVIVGEGEGSSLAYVMLSALSDTFKAGVSFGFCGTLRITAELCQEGEPRLTEKIGPALSEVRAGADISAPWDIVVREGKEQCPTLVAKQFAAQTKGAKVHYVQSEINHAALDGEYRFLREAIDRPPLPASGAATEIKELADLPLVELKPESFSANYFIILISGDGGWASLDKDLGTYFQQNGVGVVGVDSLSYFWKAKTPEKTAHDIERIILAYQAQWSRDRVVLMGYSLGANVLPFIANRLSAEQSKNVQAVVLLNPGERTSFEVHMTDWLNISELERGREALPEVQKMPMQKILCVYGEEEDDSLCPKVSGKATVEKLSGGHHFDGDYEALGAKIMKFIADDRL